VLERKLRADAVAMHRMHRDGRSLDDLRTYKQKALREMYRFLAVNLGEPPTEFHWRYEMKERDDKDDSPGDSSPTTSANGDRINGDKHGATDTATNLSPSILYTPRSFYNRFVGVPLHDYVCLYNDPTNDYHQRYQFKGARNIVGAKDMDFVNLPIETLKQVAMKSVMQNQPLWFAADVGKDQSSEHGLMADRLFEYGPLFGVQARLSKADRIKYRAGGSNHAMVFMGVDVKDGKPVKWLVENSWGADKGDQGTWTLYDKWFDEHVYCIIVHKRFVDDDVLAVFNKEPVVLPPWYPGAMGIE